VRLETGPKWVRAHLFAGLVRLFNLTESFVLLQVLSAHPPYDVRNMIDVTCVGEHFSLRLTLVPTAFRGCVRL